MARSHDRGSDRAGRLFGWHCSPRCDGASILPGHEPKDCPDDNCVVAQINRFAHILGDPSQPFAARSEALKYLVHFVGDLSQPFHAMDDARGGNDIPVTVFGSTQCGDYACNLHAVWDSELIRHTGVREHRYARQLEEMIAADHLEAGPTDPVSQAGVGATANGDRPGLL